MTDEDAFAIFLSRKFHVIQEMATPLPYLRAWVLINHSVYQIGLKFDGFSIGFQQVFHITLTHDTTFLCSKILVTYL